jgi:glycosyltransferase involved in cell wall biosynthesis
MIPVSLIIATLDPAGAERLLVTLATHLDRCRFEPRVICLTRGGAMLEEELRRAGVPVEILAKTGPLDPVALWRLAKRLRQRTGGLVHTWMFTANAYGRVAALAAFPRGVIATELCVDSWKGPIRLGVDRLLSAGTSAIVANAEAVADFYRERLPSARGRILTIRGAHLPREGTPPPSPLPAGRWIGAIGRLASQKGFDVLLEAMRVVARECPEARLAIAGQGPERGSPERLTRRLGLARHCLFLGHLRDPRAILQGLEVFVLASRFEGLPNVLMEAMDAGLPCVSTRVGGCAELLEEGQAGRLVPPEDPGALAEAILGLLRNPVEAKVLALRGQERVRAHFRLEAMVMQFETLYERVWAEAGR